MLLDLWKISPCNNKRKFVGPTKDISNVSEIIAKMVLFLELNMIFPGQNLSAGAKIRRYLVRGHILLSTTYGTSGVHELQTVKSLCFVTMT